METSNNFFSLHWKWDDETGEFTQIVFRDGQFLKEKSKVYTWSDVGSNCSSASVETEPLDEEMKIKLKIDLKNLYDSI